MYLTAFSGNLTTTSKDVSTRLKCQHDMQPPAQLPSILGADNKLGLTMG